MLKRIFNFMTMRKRIMIPLFVCVAAGVLFYTKVTVEYRQDREGIYLLKGEGKAWLDVTDDLYPEEINRLMWGMPLPKLKRATTSGACKPTDGPCTMFEWNEEVGRGFIKTLYPDGKKLIVALGRFIDSNGKPVSGLFLGGNLPPSDPDFQMLNSNETGMAFFDGNRFFHIWCNVNEGIEDAESKMLYPSDWAFLSSKILENSAHDLSITSKHQTLVNNVPVSIDRTLFYQTGDTFVTLTTRVINIGNVPTVFAYIYGDEPWLGNFGSSLGNIGWFKDGLIETERKIDTRKYYYLGMFDHGNPLAGDVGPFTEKANFLEWSPASRPDLAYVSNQFNTIAPPEQKVPLKSYNNRVISLQWGPRALPPGQALLFVLKVGMADNDSKTGLPVKPDTHLF